MKSILISIKPEWVQKIFNREKTIEIRKTRPNIDLPVKVYIYCTKPKKWYRVSSILQASDELLWKERGVVKLSSGFEYMYVDSGDDIELLNQKIVAEFTLNKIDNVFIKKFSEHNESVGDYYDYTTNNNLYSSESLVSDSELIEYLNGKTNCYAWHISDLKIYDKPKELSEFSVINPDVASIGSFGWVFSEEELPKFIPIKKAPQSWQYVWGEL